ncbi:uncharacterized protein DEA37_0013917 [Paragonimus westermani]|uniref:ZSWIM3 N-terminal domain-containing protein n=1 Tax=Paragonimus westermani TaxID=34504 RepID=A0A5J4N932_9TREM|nr:uncharacterized protein DEA37_0013917 [Paragonimus westermani]
MLTDDSDTFWKIFKPPYTEFEKYLNDLRTFQRETCSSFFISTSQTAAMAKKYRGVRLPPGQPYASVVYKCVHCRRRTKASKRFTDYGCSASWVMHYRSDGYRIEKANLQHSHNFQVGNPGLYPRNRRLSPADEVHVYEMMQHFKSTRDLKEYVKRTFAVAMLSQDVNNLRTRHAKQEARKEKAMLKKILKSEKPYSRYIKRES